MFTVTAIGGSLRVPLLTMVGGGTTASFIYTAPNSWQRLAPAVTEATPYRIVLTALNADGVRETLATLDVEVVPPALSAPVITLEPNVKMDGGRAETYRAKVVSVSGQGVTEVTLGMDGKSIPMTSAGGDSYEARVDAPVVTAQTSVKVTVTAKDGNGLIQEEQGSVTVWPAGPPVLGRVTFSRTTVEPGDWVDVSAQASSDSRHGVSYVEILRAGERVTTLHRSNTGGFTGMFEIHDTTVPGLRTYTARAVDYHKQFSAEQTFQVTVAKSTRPELDWPTIVPGGAVVGQRVTFEATATSSVGLASGSAYIGTPGTQSVAIPFLKVSGTERRAVYRGTWTPSVTGVYSLSVEVKDRNGRTSRTHGLITITVKARSDASVVSATASRTILYSNSAHTATLTVVTRNAMYPHVTCGSLPVYYTGGSGQRSTYSVSVAKPGRYPCTVVAVDRDFVRSPAKSVTVVAQRAASIWGFNASPEPVRRGRTIKVAGALEVVTASGRYGYLNNAPIAIMFRKKGSSTYTRLATVTTSGKGGFSKKLTARTDGYWKAVYAGSTTYASATSRVDYVDVRG